MARKTGELKKRCRLAKQRLKMGYFNAMQERAISPLQTEPLRVSPRLVTVRPPDEERMYRKVCEILDSDEVTINPIGQLIDRSVYEELDSAGKQRYILELSQKFRELSERYYKERTGS